MISEYLDLNDADKFGAQTIEEQEESRPAVTEDQISCVRSKYGRGLYCRFGEIQPGEKIIYVLVQQAEKDGKGSLRVETATRRLLYGLIDTGRCMILSYRRYPLLVFG